MPTYLRWFHLNDAVDRGVMVVMQGGNGTPIVGKGERGTILTKLRICVRGTAPSKPNISKEKIKAIKELKEDQSRAILTAEKGVPMVVMNVQDYSNKAHQLLTDTNTYKPIHKDPTNKLKKQTGTNS